MSYIGDFELATTLYTKFTTVNASGVPTTLGDAPTFGFYVNANTTLFTSGVTVTADFNSTTGLNHLQMIVTTSATGITTGASCQLVIATGSVSGVSLKGYVIGEFSVLTRSPLKPVTAGRTLAVAATGGAAIDWASVGNPGSTVNLSATTLFTATNVTNNVGAIVTAVSTIVPARITAQGIDVGAIVTGFGTIMPARVTAQGIDIGAIVTGFNTIAPANVTAYSTVLSVNVTAYSTVLSVNVTACSTVVPANVTSMAAGVITATTIATGAIDADALAADAVAEIWGTTLTEAYNTDGSAATGAQLLYGLTAFLFERSISGTTLTAKKLDGSTSAMTFTLDSATPTSITRAT